MSSHRQTNIFKPKITLFFSKLCIEKLFLVHSPRSTSESAILLEYLFHLYFICMINAEIIGLFTLI